MTYETRITRLTVLPKGEPLFAETATHIQIEDEAASLCEGRRVPFFNQ